MDPSREEIPALRALIGHREFVRADETLEAVHDRFARTPHDFLAVLAGRRVAGICARRDVGTLLGARYGFALYARDPVGAHLSAAPVAVAADAPLAEVFRRVAARRDEHFYDDVLVVDPAGDFLGLVPVRELVRVQTSLLLANVAELERRQEEIARRNREMEEDLRMAREVQVALLPRGLPPSTGADGRQLRFAQVFQPAAGVSGDFFDVLPIAPGVAGLLMCDVMGHGVRSALVTAMVRTAVEDLRALASEPGLFLTRLNANLTRLLRRAGDLIFVTASYVVVDATARRLQVAHAGHPAPLLWSAGARTVTALPEATAVGGPALGLIDDFTYAGAARDLADGDRLVLLTDGLLEATNGVGEEFGRPALERELAAAAAAPLAGALEQLRAAAAAHAGPAGLADDVGLLGCELAPPPR